MKEIAEKIHDHLVQYKDEEILLKCEKYIEISNYFPSTDQFRQFIHSFYSTVISSSSKEPNILLVGSLLTSHIERFLGDVYVSILLKENNIEWNKSSISDDQKLKRKELINSCPRMLKDLLVSPIILSFFGDLPVRIHC